jgi:hypothetical protein
MPGQGTGEPLAGRLQVAETTIHRALTEATFLAG